jgi:hypothetical protein
MPRDVGSMVAAFGVGCSDDRRDLGGRSHAVDGRVDVHAVLDSDR